jgi:hypothetical protein
VFQFGLPQAQRGVVYQLEASTDMQQWYEPVGGRFQSYGDGVAHSLNGLPISAGVTSTPVPESMLSVYLTLVPDVSGQPNQFIVWFRDGSKTGPSFWNLDTDQDGLSDR